jgi:hypothetical protein
VHRLAHKPEDVKAFAKMYFQNFKRSAYESVQPAEGAEAAESSTSTETEQKQL